MAYYFLVSSIPFNRISLNIKINHRPALSFSSSHSNQIKNTKKLKYMDGHLGQASTWHSRTIVWPCSTFSICSQIMSQQFSIHNYQYSIIFYLFCLYLIEANCPAVFLSYSLTKIKMGKTSWLSRTTNQPDSPPPLVPPPRWLEKLMKKCLKSNQF